MTRKFNNPRLMSTAGIEHLKQFEGCVLYAYDDLDPRTPKRRVMPGDAVRGTLTIGYGHTASVKPGMEIDAATALAILRHDLEFFEKGVAKAVTGPINQHQFDALVALAYNIGLGNFKRSRVLAYLNAGNYYEAAEAFMAWKSSKGQVLEGLVRRRKAEQILFRTAPEGPRTTPPSPPRSVA